MKRLLSFLSLALLCAAPAQAGVIYSASGGINGSETPSFGQITDFSTTVSFQYSSTGNGGGGDYGVVVSELGQQAINTGWHDSQVEVSTAGSAYVSVWPYQGFNIPNGGQINLGHLSNGTNSITYGYDSTHQLLSASLNGGTVQDYSIARQDPVGNGQSAQVWAFGVPDLTNQTGAYTPYSNKINSATISVPPYSTTPEPASLTLLGLGGVGLILARRRKLA